MRNYFWAWKDEDGVYINKAENLKEIIEEVLEYYLDYLITEDDDKSQIIERVIVNKVGNNFVIKVITDDDVYEDTIDENTYEVVQFLEMSAFRNGRVDQFSILENNY